MTMRILHVNSERTWRGGERQLFLQLKYSDPAVENSVVCLKGGALEKRLRPLGIRMHHAALRNSLDLISAWRLRRLCHEYDVSVLHCHTPKAHAIGAISLLMGNTSKLVVTKRTIFPIGANPFSKWKYRKAHLVICVSKAVEQIVHQRVPSARTCVIPSGIEKVEGETQISISKIIPSAAGKKIVGYVAAITAEKNPATFLEVARKILSGRKDIIFLWIGDGALRNEVATSIQKYQLEDLIILTGFQANVIAWIDQMNVLFFPSLSEGFPTTILDAMIRRVPVVASNTGGIKEIVDQGNTGFLHNPSDVDGFTNSIEQLLRSPDTCEAMTSRAKHLAEKYLVSAIVPNIYHTYQALVDK